jgi:hypothetical protein
MDRFGAFDFEASPQAYWTAYQRIERTASNLAETLAEQLGIEPDE